MKIQQLSLFLENQPGQLRVPCKVLGDAGINILTLSLADTQQFGILRLIVKDWEKAKEVLEGAGIVVNVTEVLAVEVPDRPGGLASVLESFEKAGLSIEYMYAFAAARERGKFATLVFRLEDPERAAAAPAPSAGVKLAHLRASCSPGPGPRSARGEARGREPDLGPGGDAPARASSGPCRAGASPSGRRAPRTCRSTARPSRRRGSDPDVDPRAPDDVRRLPFTTKDDLRRNYPLGLLAVPRARGRPGPRLVGHHRQAHLRRLHEARPRDLVRPRRPLPRRGRAPLRAPRPRRLRLRPLHRRLRPALRDRAGRRRRRAGRRREHAAAGACSSSDLGAEVLVCTPSLRPAHRRGRAAPRGSAPASCRCASATSAASPGPRRCASRSSASSASSPSTTTASPR